MNDVKVKQQIVDKIKASTNILVTVSNDPSVDALSAALGITLLLNKMSKHATAIFSGATPPAITFLDPQKVFEASTDSLRDFIIALDKNKADHLRYKVDGDVVKIFITPYRTTITGDDLEFSQGDYNVEMVIALGVENQSHLDAALEAHGSILHDATVVTICAGDQTSSLGSLDWADPASSSLSEMVVGLAESLKTEKDTEPLLDQEIATALLTGIVAETDRFSNPKTTSKVMTLAAQLMAAGADQQLIAAKLQESHEIGQTPQAPASPKMTPDVSVKLSTAPESSTQSGLAITHDEPAAETPAEVTVDVPEPTVKTPDDAPSVSVSASGLSGAYALDPEEQAAATAAIQVQPTTGEPLLGGTLNATTEQAAEDAQRERDSDKNKTILSHAYMSDTPTISSQMNGAAAPSADDAPGVDVFAAQPPADLPTPTAINPAYALDTSEAVMPASEPAAPAESTSPSHEDALAAVHATFESSPTPAPAPSFSPTPGVVLPPPPPLPDFSTLPPLPTQPTQPAPERLGDIFAPEAAAPPVTPASNDPAQFKIPGQ